MGVGEEGGRGGGGFCGLYCVLWGELALGRGCRFGRMGSVSSCGVDSFTENDVHV